MPCLYDFICRTCNIPIQAWLTFDDIDNKVKPTCQKCNAAENVHRDWTTGSPIIKKFHGHLVPTQINNRKV